MNAFPKTTQPDSSRLISPDPEDHSRSRPPTASVAGSGPEPGPVKRSLRLLCIDDDEQILETMQVCLGHLGHQVKAASGGKCGMEVFHAAVTKSEPYDAVITDMNMPDINGYLVAQAIKAESPQTPVIVLSGAAGTSKEAGVPPASVDAIINKPASMKELNELLLRMTIRA